MLMIHDVARLVGIAYETRADAVLRFFLTDSPWTRTVTVGELVHRWQQDAVDRILELVPSFAWEVVMANCGPSLLTRLLPLVLCRRRSLDLLDVFRRTLDKVLDFDALSVACHRAVFWLRARAIFEAADWRTVIACVDYVVLCQTNMSAAGRGRSGGGRFMRRIVRGCMRLRQTRADRDRRIAEVLSKHVPDTAIAIILGTLGLESRV